MRDQEWIAASKAKAWDLTQAAMPWLFVAFTVGALDCAEHSARASDVAPESRVTADAASTTSLPPAYDQAGLWTVATISPSGAWGIGIDASKTNALLKAIVNCKAMSKQKLGCGAWTTRVQKGWSSGARCGDGYILAAAKSEFELEERILARARELRTNYYPNLPRCTRVFVVDPFGRITTEAFSATVTLSAFPDP